MLYIDLEGDKIKELLLKIRSGAGAWAAWIKIMTWNRNQSHLTKRLRAGAKAELKKTKPEPHKRYAALQLCFLLLSPLNEIVHDS